MSETRNCQNCKNQFAIEPEDLDIYGKMDVPPPTWCQLCRMQRRMAFRNERKIFWATSGLSGKKVLTLYAPQFGFTIYDDDEWRSDAWNPATYGRDIDWSRPFLAQVKELIKVVPKAAAARLNMVNSEYSGNADGLKNCYLLFNSNHSEDCAYGNGMDYCAQCFDDSHVQKSQMCYGSFWLTNCNRVNFSSRCEDCTSLWFSRDMTGCSDCFGCANLRMKKYCIFNLQYTKDEYQIKLNEFNLSSWSGLQSAAAKAREIWAANPYKFMQGVQNTRVSGEYINNSKNIVDGYIIREGEDIRYSQYLQVPPGKDIYDSSLFGDRAELLYENSVSGWGGRNLKFCFETWSAVENLEYCMFCQRVRDSFGCVGMRDGQYCILNKPYSEAEYKELVPRVKKHMDEMPYTDEQGRIYRYGEFFPPGFAPIAYNHSIAPEHFPLTKEQALANGFIWLDSEEKEFQTTMTAGNLPDDIKDVEDSVTKEIIKCENCGRGYRIIPDELNFLRKINLPLPHICVDCRHDTRIAQRNRARFYERKCRCGTGTGTYKNNKEHIHGADPCPNSFRTSYAPDRPEIVYCEACYNAEVA